MNKQPKQYKTPTYKNQYQSPHQWHCSKHDKQIAKGEHCPFCVWEKKGYKTPIKGEKKYQGKSKYE